MNKSFAVLTLLALFGAPLTATAETACPMMMKGGEMAIDQVTFSAQANSCCPKGACDCSIQAPSPMAAQAPQVLRTAAPDSSATTLSSALFSVLQDASAQKQETSESPPAPDKPYKLTSQYRI